MGKKAKPTAGATPSVPSAPPDPKPKTARRRSHGPSARARDEISDRKLAEEELRNNEWRRRYAIDSARLTYVEVDLVHGEARTPENFAAVMGYVHPPEHEKDISAGTRLLLAHVVPQDRERVALTRIRILRAHRLQQQRPGSRPTQRRLRQRRLCGGMDVHSAKAGSHVPAPRARS